MLRSYVPLLNEAVFAPPVPRECLPVRLELSRRLEFLRFDLAPSPPPAVTGSDKWLLELFPAVR